MRHRPDPPAFPAHRDTQRGSSALHQARQQALRLDRAFVTSNAIGLAVTLILDTTIEETAESLLAHGIGTKTAS